MSLLKNSPEMAETADRLKRTPLHIFCKRILFLKEQETADPNFDKEIIQKLLEALVKENPMGIAVEAGGICPYESMSFSNQKRFFEMAINEDRKRKDPSPVNDEGARLALGRDGKTYYCGRYIGIRALKGSDGQCGPTSGPQCLSCRRGVVKEVKVEEKEGGDKSEGGEAAVGDENKKDAPGSTPLSNIGSKQAEGRSSKSWIRSLSWGNVQSEGPEDNDKPVEADEVLNDDLSLGKTDELFEIIMASFREKSVKGLEENVGKYAIAGCLDLFAWQVRFY